MCVCTHVPHCPVLYGNVSSRFCWWMCVCVCVCVRACVHAHVITCTCVSVCVCDEMHISVGLSKCSWILQDGSP